MNDSFQGSQPPKFRLADQEHTLAEREQKLLDREEATLRRERAYIGRMLALAEMEQAIRKREEALHTRAERLGPEAEVVAKLTSPQRNPPFFDPDKTTYEALEVARQERMAAISAREEALIARLDTLSARTRVLSAEEAMLGYREELLRVRSNEISRMSRSLDAMEGARTMSDPGHRDLLDRRVDEALNRTAPVPTAVAPMDQTPVSKEASRRKHKRIGVKVYVGLESAHNFYTGFTQNISNGGLFIATHNPLEVGQRVELLFHLPSGSAIRTQGEVAWIREYNEATPDIPPGMGVRFLDLSPEDSAKIREFVAEREPMFYEGN